MVAVVGMVLVARPRLASAQNYTWSGTNALWTTSNWITSTGTTTFPAGSSGTNTAIINSGTVSFAGNDTFGNSATTSSPVIRLGSGGTLASGGFFNTLWNVNLNGGTLLANGGAASSFPTFQLAGTLTVDGTTASNISVGGGSNNQVNIGGQGNSTLTVNVADVTSSAAADLTIGTVLQNLSGGAGALTKTGAGTLELSAANTYTGATNINGGVLRIASGGSLTSAGNINSTAGGQLSIAGSVTMAADTYFAVGNGIVNTTGTTSIDGGSLNVGTGAFLIGGGRSGVANGGLGTFVVNSGTVTVGAAGGAGGGQDTQRVYLNPYATSGTSQLLLNGGVFSIARPISDGGGGQSLVAYNGGTLRLGGSISVGGATTNVIHSGGAVIDTNGFNGTLNVALATGTGATAGGLTKINSGTLTMSVANSYTGTTTVSGGVLRYGIANAISTGAVTVDSGATLDLATFNDSVGAVTLTSGNIIGTGTLTSTSGFTVTSGSISAPLAGSVGLTKQGAGTVTLSAANPYTGATDINGGLLQIASGGALTSAGSINSTAGGRLSISGSVTMASNTYFAVGNGILNTTGTTSIDGGTLAVGNSAFLIGGSRQSLGTSGGLGTFVLNSGTVTVAAGGAGGGQDTSAVWLAPYSSGTSQLILNGGVFSTARQIQNGSGSDTTLAFNGGTLQLAADRANIAVSLSRVLIHSGGAVIDTNGFNGTFLDALTAGTGSPAGGLTKLGSGTLTLSAANTYTGTTTISRGVLALSSAGSLASTSPVAITGSGATFNISGASGGRTIGMLTGTAGSTVVLGGNTLTVGDASSGAFAGVISGSGGLTKQGAGTLTLAGANTYSGATTVNAGALVVGSGGSLSSAGNINTTGGGSLSIVGSVTTATNTYFAVGNGILNTTGTTTIDGGSLDVGTNAFLIGGSRNGLGSTGGLGTFVVNSGTVTVGAAGGTSQGGQDANLVYLNPYSTSGTSQLILNGGVFSIARGISDGGGGQSLMAYNGGTLRIGANNVNIGGGATTVIHSGGAVIDTNGFNGTLNMPLATGTGATPGGLTKINSGTLTMSVANTYSGTTRVSAGVLSVTNANALQNSTLDLNVLDSGTITFGQNSTFGGLTGSRNLDMATRTLTVGNNGQSTTYSGTLSNGGLTKAGSGTLTLSAANIYTGTTTVSAGVLRLTGGNDRLSTSGPIALAGGTLDLGGNTQATSGAVTFSGASGLTSGTLTVTNNTSLIPTGTLTLGNGAAFVANQADERLILGFGTTNNFSLTGSAGSSFTVGGNADTRANYIGVDNGSATLTVNGPTLNIQVGAGQSDATGGWLRIGANSGATGLVTLTSGTINIGHSASLGAHFQNSPTANATSSGTLTIAGGVFNVGTGTTTTTAGGNNGYLYLKNDAAGSSGNAVVNLNGGVLSVKRIVPGTGGGTKQVNLDGGTILAAASDASFMNAAPGFSVNVGNGGGTIDTAGADITISTALLASGTGGIRKIGAGGLTLSGSNTYTGLTSVAAGLLKVNGSIDGELSVDNLAILGGSGTINGFVSIAGGGILAPGQSPGTLTMTSGLSLADAAVLNYELVATDTTVGGGINDLTEVTGNFILDGILNVAGTGDFSTVPIGTKWILFNYSGGTFTDNGLLLGLMPSLGSSDKSFEIDTATPGQVSLVVVPEPSGIAVAGIGVALAGWLGWRRRSSTVRQS
jgi:autotransporter-associated beta strand protein